MEKKTILMSGLASANAGLAALASAGFAYFLDPKRGEQRLQTLRKYARALYRDTEGAAQDMAQRMPNEAAKLVRWIGRLSGERRPSPLLPLAAAGIGLSLGSGLMYLLDPKNGSQRRAWLRDTFMQAAEGIKNAIQDTLHPEWIEDAELADRVQTVIQYVVAHPEQVTISAHEGIVTVGGSIPEAELEKLLACVSAVRGVQAVSAQLGESVPANGAGSPLYRASPAH